MKQLHKEVDEKTDNKLYPQSSDEVNNLCSYPMDNTYRDGLFTNPKKCRRVRER